MSCAASRATPPINEDDPMLKSRLIPLAAAASIAATLAAAPMAGAADDYFLKIDGVAGESQGVGTTGAIEVDGFEWGAENKNTISSASTGAGTVKAQLKELTIQKKVDASSPVLFQKLAQATLLTGMELVARKSGPTPLIYMRYTFQPVFVTSQTHSGSGDDGVEETLMLTYGAVRQTYTKQTATGAP